VIAHVFCHYKLASILLFAVLELWLIQHYSSRGIYFLYKISPVRDLRSTPITTVVTAKFKVTWHKNQDKKSKIRPRKALAIVPYCKNQWSFASSHCKWRRG